MKILSVLSLLSFVLGNAWFTMSTYPVSFYDFANYFKQKGCSEALYFDGFVSRSFCPQQNYRQLDGDFGVIIGLVKPAIKVN